VAFLGSSRFFAVFALRVVVSCLFRIIVLSLVVLDLFAFAALVIQCRLPDGFVAIASIAQCQELLELFTYGGRSMRTISLAASAGRAWHTWEFSVASVTLNKNDSLFRCTRK